jgi:multidrug efflux system membrane fusion protein
MRASAESQAATVQADRAAIENSRESMRADRAAIENAKLQLDYCNIRSPIDGRTGNLIVHAGNLIKSNDTVLVNINQITPLYVSFAVPEQQLSEIKRRMAAGSLKVEVSAPGETLPRSQGTLTFVNNTVDSTTGTIRLKARFANEARRLWPGQFVDVVMTLATERNAVLVPSQAVQTGQSGTYVFLVRPDLRVEIRPVVAGRNLASDVVIEKGLAAGDRVVTDGQLRLVPGAPVEVKPAPEAGQGAHP